MDHSNFSDFLCYASKIMDISLLLWSKVYTATAGLYFQLTILSVILMIAFAIYRVVIM